jgi:hypothetical protein
VFFRRSKYKALKAEVERLEGDLQRVTTRRIKMRARLQEHERIFPYRKRELCEELLPFVRSLVASPLDWRAPVIERTHAEAEIRRLLGLIDELQPDYGLAEAPEPQAEAA